MVVPARGLIWSDIRLFSEGALSLTCVLTCEGVSGPALRELIRAQNLTDRLEPFNVTDLLAEDMNFLLQTQRRGVHWDCACGDRGR